MEMHEKLEVLNGFSQAVSKNQELRRGKRPAPQDEPTTLKTEQPEPPRPGFEEPEIVGLKPEHDTPELRAKLKEIGESLKGTMGEGGTLEKVMVLQPKKVHEILELLPKIVSTEEKSKEVGHRGAVVYCAAVRMTLGWVLGTEIEDPLRKLQGALQKCGKEGCEDCASTDGLEI